MGGSKYALNKSNMAAAAILKTVKSRYLWNRSTDFWNDRIKHMRLLKPYRPAFKSGNLTDCV